MTLERKSPSKSATDFSVGTKKKGNDNNIWKVIKTKNNVHRWQKILVVKKGSTKSSKKVNKDIYSSSFIKKLAKNKKYFIHDNGGRPFMVNVSVKNVEIYKLPKNFENNIDPTFEDYNTLVKAYKNVKNVFIGKSVKGDDGNGWAGGIGNSILLHLSANKLSNKLSNKYCFIGEFIYEFEIPDIIEQFHSMIGNSDVSYPVAIGKTYVYFLINKGQYGYLSKEYFEDFPKKHKWALESYDKLWGQGTFRDNPTSKTYNPKSKTSLYKYTKKIPKIKIIQKRK
jgi:hypothetical protein